MTDEEVSRIAAAVAEKVSEQLARYDKTEAGRSYKTNEELRALRRAIEAQGERLGKCAAAVASIFGSESSTSAVKGE